jgi:hypothetical protein
MMLPDVPPLSWFEESPVVREFYRACCEYSLTYLYAPHEEAMTTRIEFVDEPNRDPTTARKFALMHEVPDEQVLRAASVGATCAGHRIKTITGKRWRLRGGLICCSGTNAKFRNATEAAAWAGCHRSNVAQVLLGTTAMAAGLYWWREVDGKRVDPVRRVRPKSMPVSFNGVLYPSIKAAAKSVGISRRRVEVRAERLTA